jgi:hypothetical protein
MGVRSARGITRSCGRGRDIDGPAVGGGVAFVQECVNAIPAGTCAGTEFIFGNHLIGLKKDSAEIRERGRSLTTHATGGDFAGKSGERVVEVDFADAFAHERLEFAKKIFVTRSS